MKNLNEVQAITDVLNRMAKEHLYGKEFFYGKEEIMSILEEMEKNGYGRTKQQIELSVPEELTTFFKRMDVVFRASICVAKFHNVDGVTIARDYLVTIDNVLVQIDKNGEHTRTLTSKKVEIKTEGIETRVLWNY